jgi:Rrf2 family iron-sulfur cluster assembly transcriptional regulator
MRLSTRGKYALEALVFLSYKSDNEETMSLNAIGEATGISDGYLEQLFRNLKKDGIVKSKKGKYGGYYLAKPAQDITVGDVLLSVEGPLSLVRCSESETCKRQAKCLTHKLWDAAYIKLKETISEISIAMLVADYSARLKKADI